MSSYSKKFCYCDVKVAALCVAIYKVLFTLASLIASAVGAYVYSDRIARTSETTYSLFVFHFRVYNSLDL
ncbi:Protein of unknown function, partial [Gryllus bimaculatus]